MSNSLPVIGVIGQKGGGGKTTVSINIAVRAAERDKAVVIIDVDQQANSSRGRDRRKSENVAVVATHPSRIKQTIETAQQHGAEFVVIDSPGHNDSAVIETVRASDIILLPVEAQMFHFDTLPAMCDLIRLGGGKPTWVVINKLHPAALVQAEKIKKLLIDTYSIPVCPVHLSQYAVYATSSDVGLTALEQEPESKAAEEIRNLYKFICQQLNNLRSKNVKNARLAAGA
jgi:chromosome partitioning protein